MFKLGRNVVAKESDVNAWVESQYAAAGFTGRQVGV
jgi:predicted DNA-binding transcriptional regulator AlpA